MISRFTLLLAAAASSVHGLISGPFAPRRGATSRAAVHMGLAVPLTDFDGARVGEEDVDLRVARAGAYVVHRKVVAEQANMRLGTASTKTRSEVRGGGRKPYQQKGTGRARRGSSVSPARGRRRELRASAEELPAEDEPKEKQVAISTALMSAMPRAKLVQDFEENSPRRARLVSEGGRGRFGGARAGGGGASAGGRASGGGHAGGRAGRGCCRACMCRRAPPPGPCRRHEEAARQAGGGHKEPREHAHDHQRAPREHVRGAHARPPPPPRRTAPARSRGAPSDATRGRTCVLRAGTCRRATSPTSTSSPSTTSTRGTSCGCAAKPAPSFRAPARRALARARSGAVSRRVHRRRSSSSRPPRWARCASVTARPSGLRGPTPPPPPRPFLPSPPLSPSCPRLPPPSPSPNPVSPEARRASIDCALRLRCSRWEEECGAGDCNTLRARHRRHALLETFRRGGRTIPVRVRYM